MHKFLEPRSVVLIGVSRQTGPGAYNNLEMLLRYGYEGRVYLVHPKVDEILGRKTHASVAELPEVPDLAVISLGRERVLQVFSECTAKGIRRVIIISQGFADADQRGKELQGQLVALAQESGTRIIGPNTLGVLNAHSNLSSSFVDIPKDSPPSPLTVVAQTGVLQVGIHSFTAELGKAVDLGNACDVDFVDVLTYLENDPQTEIIALHIEGIVRGREFLQTAARVARRKPIVVLKTGRSSAGARAALSHTGALVGEDELVDTAFARAGLVRAYNMIELRAACQAFLHFRPMKGARLGVVTATGACGIIAADACETYGLELATLPDAMHELENSHIAWHRLRNPVDIWPLGMVSGSFSDIFIRAACSFLQDENVDAILGIAPVMSSPLHKDLDMVAAMRKVQLDNSAHKPIALWFYGDGVAPQYRALTHMADVACFDSIDEAIMGLAATWRYEKFRQEQQGAEDPLLSTPRETPVRQTQPPDQGLLVGDAAFSLLRQFQISTAPGSLARSAEEATAIAADLGFPVVLKIVSPTWSHKSDWGGVSLELHTEAEVQSSYEALMRVFAERTPGGALEGILVQKHLKGTELLVGLKRDEQFGHFLVVGAGGIYTEIFQDAVRSLVPVDRATAEAMLKGLRIYPILQGTRGQPGVNISALVDTLVAVSRLASHYPEVGELDINPLFACSDGCWCVDSRIVFQQPD